MEERKKWGRERERKEAYRVFDVAAWRLGTRDRQGGINGTLVDQSATSRYILQHELLPRPS